VRSIRVSGDPRAAYRVVPIAVFDDGAHCYIKLLRGSPRGSAGIVSLADDGSRILLNYNLVGDSY